MSTLILKPVLWRWHQDALVSSWQYFRGFCRKSLPADSRHSNWYELCPSSRRHLSVFIRSGFHTVFALNGKETVSISVQSISHLQVHRWCIVHVQPRIRKLSGPDVFCWTWNQGHHREHHFFFLPRFTSVDWEGLLTSHFHLRQTSSNIPSSPAYGVFISQLIRYARACSSYEYFILSSRRLSSKIFEQGYIVERLEMSFSPEVTLADTGILFSNMKSTSHEWHSVPWPTVASQAIRLSTNCMTLIPSLTFAELGVVSMEHWVQYQKCAYGPYRKLNPNENGVYVLEEVSIWIATGVACQRGSLTPPDTWFRPLHGGLYVFWLLRLVFPTLHRFHDRTELDFHRIERFQWNICDGCGMTAGSAYPSGHLVLSPFLGLACAPIVETRFLELSMSLLDFSPWIPVGTFSISFQ